MSDAMKQSWLSRPITNKNHVPDMIEKIAAAKRTGKFTFQAGRADKFVNLGMGLFVAFSMVQCAGGIYSLANGVGKKDGF